MALPPRARNRVGRPPVEQRLIRRPAPGELAPAPAIVEEIRNRQTAANPLDRIIDRSMRTGQPARPTPEDLSGVDEAEDAIGKKMTALSGSPEFKKEYQLKLIHRMLVRQLSMDLIAQALGCTVRNAYLLREQLYKQLREEAANKDLPTYVGMTDGFFNEVIGMAMRMASNSKVSDQRKLGAMQVALQAQRDRTHFYEVIGFHDIMKLSPASGMTDRTTEQADKLIEMSQNVLAVFSDDHLADSDDGPLEPRDVFTRHDADEDEEVVRARVL